jgi:hypothetical protein
MATIGSFTLLGHMEIDSNSQLNRGWTSTHIGTVIKKSPKFI